MGLRGQRLTLAIASVGAIAFILQGYDQSLMNGLLTLQSFTAQFPAIDTTAPTADASTSTLQGTTVALYEVGSAFGSLSCFVIGDWLGRRYTIFKAGCIIIIGVILQATPFQLAQLIVARIVTGLGVGIFSATIPVWVAECSKAHNRGKMVMMEGWGAIGGVFFVSWIELGFYYVQGSSASWRVPIALQSVFAIFVLSVLLFLPESPRWLITKERTQQACDVLGRLSDVPTDSELVKEDVAVIHASFEAEHGGDSTNPFAITQDRQLHRTLVAIALNALAQMTGVNLISFYSNVIFEGTLGFSQPLSRIITACLQTWQFLCAGFAVLLIDRFGRRRLLLVCSLLMAVAHAGLAALTKFSQANHTAALTSLIFDFVALGAFPIGLFLVPFLVTAEIAPLRVRAKVTAMGSSVNWLFNFLLAEVTPVGFQTIGWEYYLVYLCTSVLCAVFVYFFVPETKGRSLEDIDAIFQESKTIFDPVRIARSKPVSTGPVTVLDEKEGSLAHGDQST